MSAPSCNGRVKIGVATVESTHSTASTACAISAIAAMSVIVHSGLLGVSIQNSPVSPGLTAARTASRSEVSTKLTRWPYCPISRSQERKPQYITSEAMMWVGRSSASSTAVAAAMPEPNSSASSAPSNAAIRLSACWTERLSVRP